MSPNIRHLYLPAPHLASTYMTFATPGGAALEFELGLRAGTAHLIEHLFYRQNDLLGCVFDRLGGKFGLVTRAETLHAFAGFSPTDAPEAYSHLLRSWQAFSLTPLLLAEERDVVIDEIRHARLGASRLAWRSLLSRLFPDSHLAADFGGDAESLAQADCEEILDAQKRVRDLPSAIVAIGPCPPWADAESGGAGRWCPPAPRCVPNVGTTQLAVRGIDGALVAAARPLHGLLSPCVAGAYAAYSALQYARLHPSLRRFHEQLALRNLQMHLKLYANAGVLLAMARCPFSRVAEVAELLEQLLNCPMEGGHPRQVQAATRYHLGWLTDGVETRGNEEATRALLGAASLAETAAAVDSMPAEQLIEMLNGACLAPAATVVLSSQ